MDPIIVETKDDVAALAKALRDRSRTGEAIVALTSRPGNRAPAIDPDAVREQVLQSTLIYIIEHGRLTRELARLLPAGLEVFGGAARIWWLPLDDFSDPYDHPLIFASGVHDRGPLDRLQRQFAAGPPKNRNTACGRGARTEVDAATAFPHGLRQAWLDTFAEADRDRYPLGSYIVGASLLCHARGPLAASASAGAVGVRDGYLSTGAQAEATQASSAADRLV